MTENADTNKEVKTMEENPTIKLEVTEAEESKSNREETTKGENPAINMELTYDEETSMKLIIDEDAEINEDITMVEVNEINVHETPTEESNSKREERTKAENPAINMELTDDEETSMKLIIDEDAEINEDITMVEVNEINVHETPTEESNSKREERTKAENPAINMELTDDEETSMKLIIDEDADRNEDITMKEVDETNVNETVTDNIGNNAELNAEDENMPRKYVFDLDYGFKKVSVRRLNGKTKGKYDVFLISPKNKRLRSMREVEEYLTKHYPNIPLNHFDLKNPLDSRVKHKTTGIPNEIISIKEAKNVSLTTKTRSSKRARKTTPKIYSKKPNKKPEDDDKFKCTEVTLEHGFKKLIKERISEDKSSKSYVIIVTPEGKNIRGYPELHKYMKENYPQLPHNLFDLKKPLEMIKNDRRKRKLEASASEPPVKKLKTSTTENEEFDVTLVLPKNKGDLYKVRSGNILDFSLDEIYDQLVQHTIGIVTDFVVEEIIGVSPPASDTIADDQEDIQLDIFDSINEKVKEISDKETNSIKSRHQKKKIFWVKKYGFPSPINKTNHIHTLSHRVLTEKETEILSHGLKYIPSHPIDVPKTLAAVETSLQHLNETEKINLRNKIIPLINKSKNNLSKNLSHVDKNILKSLRTDSSIVITTADKGSATVILNKQDYTQKMENLLEDKNYYRKVKNICINDLVKKFNKKLTEGKKKSLLTE
ncbi:hypothetical protein LAZ67_9002548 [Cordylochernes scorpioides]|uniref:MBD domain-containing protein n=1 Tax=Cordylochernes scorpioides TaxID=51811 RepID=A0ABY6KTX8_9ARAC|nr:hypothetical protein LAZ67_9002548 [Cordylochernes scorpioides]